jgi:type-F conjugative transfer system secretin TraK
MAWCVLANAQVIFVSENTTLKIKIAGAEPTRIAVEGDRIAVLRGLEGAYTYSNDNQGGAVFLKPAAAYQNKPFYLFVSTEQGHNYILQCHPTKTLSAGMLILKPRPPEEDKAEKFAIDSPYLGTLATLMTHMANGSAPENYEVIQIKHAKTIPVGLPLKLQLKTRYSGAHLQGEIYEVTNTSNRRVLLREPIFYLFYFFDRPGDRAIALKDKSLLAGGKTFLYRITSHG